MKTWVVGWMIVAALAIAALGYWSWHTLRAPTVATAGDDFDYARAFEQTSATDGTPLWPLAEFAGRTRAQAEAVLGAPWGCEPSLYSLRCRYPGEVEVVYIDDRADWITLHFDYGRHALNPSVLALLGAPVGEPTQQDQTSMTWTRLAGWREVRVVGDRNGALFARIKVSHE